MNEIIEKIKRHFRFRKKRYIRFERSYLKNKNERAILKFLLRSFVFSFILLIGVMLLPPVKYILMYLTGTSGKLELIQLIGWGMSGIIAVFVAFGLLQRAAALDKQNEISEKGNFHERFKTATEHLSSDQVSLHISAFNEFYHIAEIEPDLRKTILNILCAHLRQTTKDKNYQRDATESEKMKPTDEVQSLLDVLFKPHKNNLIFGGISANLAGVNLQGADLEKANLQMANLLEARLKKANLQEANLNKANLRRANLKKADLCQAELHEAELWGANLQEANLENADMYMAELRLANLQNANMRVTNLYKANLQMANLQGADMDGTIINEKMMPDNWEDMVKKDKDGETGVSIE